MSEYLEIFLICFEIAVALVILCVWIGSPVAIFTGLGFEHPRLRSWASDWQFFFWMLWLVGWLLPSCIVFYLMTKEAFFS